MILSLLKFLHRNERSLATVGHVSQAIDLNEEQNRLCIAWKLTCRRQLSGSRSSRRKSSRRSRSRISLIGLSVELAVSVLFLFVLHRITIFLVLGLVLVLVLVLL